MAFSRTKRPARRPRTATVLRTEQLSRDLVRVVFEGTDLAELPELTFTDHYVKLLFPPAGADYTWPFDPEAIRAERPPEQWPVTRTYTIRWLDRESAQMAVDFVVHGDAGLAGPWATWARPGDGIAFFGPGGAWAPDPRADVHLFAGDEAALPAIAAALDVLPHEAHVLAYVEVADDTGRVPLRDLPNLQVQWVCRDGRPPGQALAGAVRAGGLPDGEVHAFVHGEAQMIRDLRRFLFVEKQVPKDRVSISGYWRSGSDEDDWQSGKRDFMARVEAEEARETSVG